MLKQAKIDALTKGHEEAEQYLAGDSREEGIGSGITEVADGAAKITENIRPFTAEAISEPASRKIEEHDDNSEDGLDGGDFCLVESDRNEERSHDGNRN